jgi:hypothetical protein
MCLKFIIDKATIVISARLRAVMLYRKLFIGRFLDLEKD